MLDRDKGGACENCSKVISPELLPKLIEHDLGVTVALEDDVFQIDGTLSLGELAHAKSLPPLPAREKMAGRMFGHFKLISPLGRGGMGQVYRALDTSLQRFVAVKLLRSGIEGRRFESADDKTTAQVANFDDPQPVSYTHLTLPTIYSV